MPERLKGTDCKSVGLRLQWFEPTSTHFTARKNGKIRPGSSGVEHFLGKEEVTGSNPVLGFRNWKSGSFCQNELDYIVYLFGDELWQKRNLNGRSLTVT